MFHVPGAIAIDLEIETTASILSGVNCSGSEDTLLNCYYEMVSNDESCSIAGVVCQGILARFLGIMTYAMSAVRKIAYRSHYNLQS